MSWMSVDTAPYRPVVLDSPEKLAVISWIGEVAKSISHGLEV